ncbi:3-oxoacyl-ACP synthase III family protein [Polyangium sp. y55x31]|uniref:3-oxoacyl-ACP synthase III family protein n=1 Tax=Polyangium sp. y55x31 TaxID=3042688 RepID=UPI0024826DFE|nr:3-oxoacyl-ACP synthase III family protein [Polyangium sp. y55x31]MDI1479258.1 3-oxoacyl-ACP synthase III family protein [Polyangium sp. y55x31]
MITTTPLAAGIRSLAVGFPKTVRTNDWFRERQPDVFAEFEKKTLAQVFHTRDSNPDSALFDAVMTSYLGDPFRGTRERRVLGPDESQLALESDVAVRAVRAAGLAMEDIDLMLVASFPSEGVGVGNAAYLAKDLELGRPAWNVESTCSGGLASLQMACSLVSTGQYRNVLVVVSCIYSRACDWSDTLTWFLGDGVGAFVVSAMEPGNGLLAVNAISTAETCGAFVYRIENVDGLGYKPIIRSGKSSGRALRDTSSRFVRDACLAAVEKAGMELDDVDVFICNTPLAWYADFFVQALGVSRDKTISTYDRYANIGPALMPVNMHTAATSGLLERGKVALVFTVGTVSTAGAAVMRWGDVAIDPTT